jgi:type IV pilus assembly protein PilQ
MKRLPVTLVAALAVCSTVHSVPPRTSNSRPGSPYPVYSSSATQAGLAEPPAVGASLSPAAQAVSLGSDDLTIPSGGPIMEPTEFADQDIRDVLRAIAKAYDLNIFPYPEVKGKITVSLNRMPVLDAIRNIVNPLGFDLYWDGQAYQVRSPKPKTQGTIEVGRNAITMTVKNQDIQAFSEEYGKRTGLNVLVDRNAKGQVSGTLRGVDPVDGLKAILTASGFELRSQGEAWIVSSTDDRQNNNNSMGYLGGGRTTRLDLNVRKGKVTANLKQASLSDVIQQLADQGGYNTITWGMLGGTVDANLKDVPLTQALELILQGTPFTFAMQDSILVIGDRNPASSSGQALAVTDIYYLRHLRADKVMPLLPKNLPVQGIQALPELNALLLSGTNESNVKVKDFLKIIDQEVPQVVIEAVIVEFTRKKVAEVGIRKMNQDVLAPGKGFTTGPILGAKVHADGAASRLASVGPFDLATLTLLPQDFMIQLNAMENAELAKVLARPRLTTLNGQPATINIGSSDYFQVSTADRNGVVSSDYRAFNSGITLTITPYLTKSGDITAEIKPEVRTPLSAATGDANKPPSTSTRSLSSNVRLKDGQTLILGGLIQTVDLKSQEGLPLLSAIPLIGRFFSYHTQNKQTTELAIYITPHVMTTSDSTVNIRKSMDIMEKRINGWSVDLPFRNPDPLPLTPEMASRNNSAPAIQDSSSTSADSTILNSSKSPTRTNTVADPKKNPGPAAPKPETPPQSMRLEPVETSSPSVPKMPTQP